MATSIPGPSFFGSLKYLYRMLTTERSTVYKDLYETYGGLVTFKLPIKLVFVFEPEFIGKVLKGNYLNYQKSVSYKHFHILIGKGLVTAEGNEWKNQRSIAAKHFSKKKVHAHLPMMNCLTRDYINSVEKRIKTESRITQINFLDELGEHTFKIISQALFRFSVGQKELKLKEAALGLEQYCVKRIFSLIRTPKSLPTKNNKLAQKSIDFIDEILEEKISKARAMNNGEDNFLSGLVKSGLKVKLIRDEIITYLIAGHETTNISINWTLYLLSQNKKVLAKLRTEIAEVLGDEELSAEKIDEFRYLKNIISESMRIYPPVPFLSRENIKEDYFGKYKVKKGSIIICSQFVTHRDKTIWADPMEFRPERFDEDIKKFTYFPFAEGPRKCIGELFSIQEMMCFLIEFTRRYDFELTDPSPIGVESYITLKPNRAINFKVSPLINQ